MNQKLQIGADISKHRRKFMRKRDLVSFVAPVTFLLLMPALLHSAEAGSAPVATREAAVAKARSGDPKGALVVLRELINQYPDDGRLLADTAVVANWAGDDKLVLDLYARPETPKNDVGVIEAAAQSARNLHQYPQALDLFVHAEQLTPDRWQSRLGHAMVLVDQEQYTEAAELMKTLVAKNGSEPEIERGEAYLCSRQQDFACAADMYQRLIEQFPNQKNELQCQLSRALSDLGSSTLAQSICTSSDSIDQLQLISATAAELIRWSESNDYDWQQRQRDGQQAIRMLDQTIASSKPEGSVWKQAQSDRIVALSTLHRPQEVIRSWEDLQQHKIELPDYALARIADAYLALRRPEQAEELFDSLVKRSPEDGYLWSELAFAEYEREQISDSLRTIDQAYNNAPAWLQGPDLTVPQPNRYHASLGLQAAEMRGFADLFADEQRRLQEMLAWAPANSELGRALAMTYKSRGWPIRAMKQEQVADSFDQKEDLPALEDAEIFEAAGLRKKADAVLTMVSRRDGSSPAILKFMTERAIERGWQATASSGYEFSNGRYLGNSLHTESYLYTPLVGYRWRAYAHGIGDTGQFTAGSADRERAAAGFSFESNRQSFWGEAGADTTNSGWIPTGAAGAQFSLGDQWRIRAEGDWDNVSEVQLIARLADVRARSGSASLEWRQSELRSVQTTFTRMLYSDGNQRSEFAASWAQRIITQPRLQVELTPQLWGSQNSLDSNRIYFNPRHDASLGLSTGINWVTWRRYDHRLLQLFNVSGAPYWQEHYGYMGAFAASYTQRWSLSKRLSLFGGATWNGHPYDGVREPYTDVNIGLTWGEQ